MIDTGLYDYVDVLGKAADASWLKNEAISNNIANVDTPNYKRQDVDFESTLQSALKKSSYISLDDKIDSLDISNLNASTYTDSSDYSYRLDGNNVDIDQENVEMAQNTLTYQGLTDSINQELSRIKSVCK